MKIPLYISGIQLSPKRRSSLDVVFPEDIGIKNGDVVELDFLDEPVTVEIKDNGN